MKDLINKYFKFRRNLRSSAIINYCPSFKYMIVSIYRIRISTYKYFDI